MFPSRNEGQFRFQFLLEGNWEPFHFSVPKELWELVGNQEPQAEKKGFRGLGHLFVSGRTNAPPANARLGRLRPAQAPGAQPHSPFWTTAPLDAGATGRTTTNRRGTEA